MIRIEIKEEEGLARIAKMRINGKTLETPVFFPVVHPSKKVPDYIKKTSKVVITNSYITIKNPELREKALRNGIHKLIDFDGVVMTDSGAYQLMVYRDIDVSNREIAEFQINIGSDIGVILDFPSPKGTPYEVARENAERTFKNAEEVSRLNWKNTNFVFPIHGAPFYDILEAHLMKYSSMEKFSLMALGSIVPSMSTYDFEHLFRSISKIKNQFGDFLHLFGLGHPILIAPSILFGGDSFDSASYYLFAKDDRIITPLGTRRLDELKVLPKWAVTEYTLEELKRLPKNDRIEELAKINYFVILSELENVKQAIYDGKLFEYATSIVKRFAYLRDEFFEALSIRPFRKTHPITLERGLFVQGEESFMREEYFRHFEKLGALLSNYDEIFIGKNGNFVYDSFFGIIPRGWLQIWPYFQRITPNRIDKSKAIKKIKELLSSLNVEVYADPEIADILGVDLVRDEKSHVSTEEVLAQALFYSTNVFDLDLFKNVRIRKGKKRKFAEIYHEHTLYGVFRAKDGILIPQKSLFIKIKDKMRKYVEIPKDVIGKDSILKAGIKEASKDILPGEIIKITCCGEAVGMGISRIDGIALSSRSVGGVAVKVKFWI